MLQLLQASKPFLFSVSKLTQVHAHTLISHSLNCILQNVDYVSSLNVSVFRTESSQIHRKTLFSETSFNFVYLVKSTELDKCDGIPPQYRRPLQKLSRDDAMISNYPLFSSMCLGFVPLSLKTGGWWSSGIKIKVTSDLT